MDADRHDDLLDELLGDALASAGCPDAEQLAAFVDRALGETAANDAAAHLVSCRRCRDDVAAIRAAEPVPLPAAARAAMAAAAQGTPGQTDAPRIRQLPRWLPAATAAAVLFVISTVALQSQFQVVEPTYVPVTGSGLPAATHHVSFGPATAPGAPATAAPATTAPAPATMAAAPPAPVTHTATPSAPATAAPQPPATAAAQPPSTRTPSAPAAPVPSTPAAPSTSAPVLPAPSSPEGPGTTPVEPTAPSAPGTPAAPVVAKVVNLRDLQGKLAVRRAGGDTFERSRASALTVAPGDVVTPVNGKPVSFGVAPDVTVALQSGARMAVRRVGERLELQLEQGGCAVETLGVPRAITIKTPHGDVAGALARAEVVAARSGMQTAIAEGAAVIACAGESVEVAAGQGVQCGKNGPGAVRRIKARAVSRWAEGVMPACDRHGRAGARCPVCIRAQQILDDRMARLGGGSKSRNRGGAAGEAGETEEKPEPSPAPPGGPGAPPPPPPGGGMGGPPPPPPPPPGGPGGPNQPAPTPGEKEEEAKPEGPEPAAKPRTPATPKQPTKFDLPEHLRNAPLPRCCRNGKGKCWQIVKKYGPSLPWPWPVKDKEKR